MIVLIDNKHELYPKLLEYCRINNYSPFSDLYVIELTKEDTIIGVIGIQNVCKFEPLIADNSITAKTLYDTAIGVVLSSGKFDRIEVSVPDNKQFEKLKFLYEKFDFKFIEKVNRFVKILTK